MKTNHIIQRNLTALALLSAFSLQPLALLGQGSLMPPGAPAPTMKSADQIEPRTIVNAVNTPGDANNLFIITNSGSYYLTTNLVGVSGQNGIEILTNNVTLDLNGFALQGVSGSSSGIDIPNSQTNITVRNGTISSWGSSGVMSLSLSSLNQVFERLNVSANGQYGLMLAGGGVQRDCNCGNNLWDGIHVGSGTVSGCMADNNGGNGIYVGSGTVSGCTADNNGSDGIYVGSGTVSGCMADNNGIYGIYVGSGTVSGCFVQNNAWCGIYVIGSGSAVIGNNCSGNNTSGNVGRAGIYIDALKARVENNQVTGSGNAGILVVGASGNIIIKNSVSGTAGGAVNNYVTLGAQIVGPIITNTVSGIITNSNPWANFSF